MNLGLPLSSGCNETSLVPLILIVKKEDIKEEKYGHFITCQDDEEKPLADLHCKTETDFTESLSTSYSEILQTTVEVELKKEEDEILQTTVEVEVKKEEDEQEYQDSDSPQESK